MFIHIYSFIFHFSSIQLKTLNYEPIIHQVHPYSLISSTFLDFNPLIHKFAKFSFCYNFKVHVVTFMSKVWCQMKTSRVGDDVWKLNKNLFISIHKFFCSFSLSKFIRFVMKWDKID